MKAKEGRSLMAKLEAMHMLLVEAEAFQSAVDDVYHRGVWSAREDPDHWRDLNRLDCFLEHLGKTIARLLAESREAIGLAMQAPGRTRARVVTVRGPKTRRAGRSTP
jgi:hypothetical protein